MIRYALWASTALISVLPAMAQDDITLEAVTVKGASYETEGSGSYRTKLVSVGEKEAIDPRRIPQSTTVVTHKRISDADYTSLDTAMVKAPGMLSLTNDNGRSSLYSRGFELDYLYYDGLAAPLTSINGVMPDMSIVDHVEILKGPSGLFIGTGEPAGSVNMRLKQAGAVKAGAVELSGNSFGRGRVQADMTGPISADGALRGRAVFAREAGKGFVEKQQNAVTSAYGTLSYDLTPETELTFSVSHMQRDINVFNGLPTYADGRLLDVDPKTTTEADWNYFHNNVTDVIAAVEHRLDNGGFVKIGTRYSKRDADYLYAFGAGPVDADLKMNGLQYLARDYNETSLALDAFASLPLNIWAGGNVIIGADYQVVDNQMRTGRGKIAGTFDLMNWDVSNVARPDVNYTQDQQDNSKRFGLYTQVRVAPTAQSTIVGGARLSWYDGDMVGSGPRTVTGKQKVDARLTPYLGGTYDLNENVTVYAGYTAMFQPQTAVDKNGDLIDPREGSQAELGLKADYDGLSMSAAVFNLIDKNRARQLPGETYSTASEKVSIRGLEIEATGEVMPGLQVAGGYTFTKTSYENGPNKGDVFSTYTPEHMFKLWAEYNPETGAMAPWSFGAGVTAMSSFSSEVRGTTINAPGYAVFDASAAYHIDDQTQVRLNVNNLFDRAYYSRVGSTGVFNFYGEPRNMTLKLIRRF